MTLISRAAIYRLGEVYISNDGPRHADIAFTMNQSGIGKDMRVEGFITNNGKFVDRAQAATIAFAAGQIKPQVGKPDLLFSEDLW